MNRQTKKTIKKTIKSYESLGWRIDDHTQNNSVEEDYYLFAPDGRFYSSEEIEYNICPFCNIKDEERFDKNKQGLTVPYECIHEQKLLNEEKEAKNLLNFLRLLQGIEEYLTLP